MALLRSYLKVLSCELADLIRWMMWQYHMMLAIGTIYKGREDCVGPLCRAGQIANKEMRFVYPTLHSISLQFVTFLGLCVFAGDTELSSA